MHTLSDGRLRVLELQSKSYKSSLQSRQRVHSMSNGAQKYRMQLVKADAEEKEDEAPYSPCAAVITTEGRIWSVSVSSSPYGAWYASCSSG